MDNVNNSVLLRCPGKMQITQMWGCYCEKIIWGSGTQDCVVLFIMLVDVISGKKETVGGGGEGTKVEKGREGRKSTANGRVGKTWDK